MDKMIDAIAKAVNNLAEEGIKELRKVVEEFGSKKTTEVKQPNLIAQAIKNAKLTDEAFSKLGSKLAAEFQVAESTVSRWVSGVARPAPLLADTIVKYIEDYAEGWDVYDPKLSEETAASIKRGLEDDAAGKKTLEQLREEAYHEAELASVGIELPARI